MLSSSFLRPVSVCTRSRVVQYQTRNFLCNAQNRDIPPQTASITTPEEFLDAIGRNLAQKISTESWEEFWTTGSGPELKKAGLAVKERRYMMWCMEKYRQGLPITEFAHEPPPKKTLRGWGPKIVDGKLNRSKRDRRK